MADISESDNLETSGMTIGSLNATIWASAERVSVHGDGWRIWARYRQIGVARLAPQVVRFGARQDNKASGVEPEDQACSSAKACLISPPVRYLELHLADATAAGGIRFEGVMMTNRLNRRSTTPSPLNDPCTNVEKAKLAAPTPREGVVNLMRNTVFYSSGAHRGRKKINGLRL
jgi:hypothetical protein